MAQARKRRPRRTESGTAAIPQPTDRAERTSVLVELRSQAGMSPSFSMTTLRSTRVSGFSVDEEYEPISLITGSGFGLSAESFLVRGTVANERDINELRNRPEVAGVWRDTPIAPFVELNAPLPEPIETPAAAACPIPPCDCSPGTAKGTIADVATYLGVDQIWTAGFRGTGIVVGVLDGGITAQGRAVKSGETSRRIARVTDGWPSDWGTEASKWGEHGNMCATDVLGMAPEAHLYDFRISGTGGSPGTISRALQAFNWAINRHRVDGTPQILTNSWGIFQEVWDTTYARDPNHPFTRKVVEAISEGIMVLFAAGNCGDTCPDGRCGSDNGPGKSIWGANGHPMVMTVGAVNKNEQFIGYSSRGPAALDPNKPDFCSISHFKGYFDSDSGTSAATPILAGVVALLKQAKPTLTQDECKAALKATAKDIGPTGFDQHTGSGIVQGHAAFQSILQPPRITLLPSCRRTFTPPCRPTVFPPCPRRTLAPPCRPTVIPPCPRPTLAPPCPRPTLAPPCQRPTLTPQCPRPTLGPQCPRPTLGPVCGRPPIQPPGAEEVFGQPPYAEYSGEGYWDPYGMNRDPYGMYLDPYGTYADPYGAGETWYNYPAYTDPYGMGGYWSMESGYADPYYGSAGYGYEDWGPEWTGEYWDYPGQYRY